MSIDPIRVYVLWAPSTSGAKDAGWRLARALRDRLDALGMIRDGVGFRVPVRQRSRPWRGGMKPRPIDLTAARSNVILVVEDDVMRARPGWAEYVADIAERIDHRGGADLLLPVTISQGRSLPTFDRLRLHGIRAFTPDGDEEAWSQWLRHVSMYAMGVIWVHQRTARGSGGASAKQGDGSVGSKENSRRITVFLSHAKKDGEGAALLLERFSKLAPPRHEGGVNSVDMYFDAYDTVAGSPYPEQFERAIRDGALLSIVTDAYHGRPWCMWELLTAKKYKSPIVIWDLSHRGALRSFPYLGNVPVVRTPDARYAAGTSDEEELVAESISDAEIERVLLALLSESLRMEVWVGHAESLVRKSDIAGETMVVCARPPELADLAQFVVGTKTVVYPDPPIGVHERALLATAFPQLTLLPLSEVSR